MFTVGCHMSCPCHSGKTYAECCEPYHKGQFPKTALALMRSRFSAYAKGLTNYIIDTTHPDNSQYLKNRKLWKKQVEEFSRHTEFIGLEILEDVLGDRVSFVTFTAKLKQNGNDASFTERSLFEKVGGRWLYRSGEFKLGS